MRERNREIIERALFVPLLITMALITLSVVALMLGLALRILGVFA